MSSVANPFKAPSTGIVVTRTLAYQPRPWMARCPGQTLEKLQFNDEVL